MRGVIENIWWVTEGLGARINGYFDCVDWLKRVKNHFPRHLIIFLLR